MLTSNGAIGRTERSETVTDTELLDTLVKDLKRTIAAHKAYLKKVTATRQLWQLEAYEGVLKFIKENRGKDGEVEPE
jgi:hypothetical protein